jgi:hypothetical protein
LQCYGFSFIGAVECLTPDQIKNCPDFDQYFQPESPLDPLNWDDAATLMKRRIAHAISTCPECKDTDKYIMAALSQNGPFFTGIYTGTRTSVLKLPKKDLHPNPRYVYDWKTYFRGVKDSINTSEQLRRFTDAISGFRSREWSVPSLDDIYITELIYPN